MRRVILVDRDGVLNEDRADYVKSPAELKLIPQAVEALRLLRKAGFRVLVITNQACVGKGIITLAQLEAIHEELAKQVEVHGGRIDGFYVCPHAPWEGCECRKPSPGLIFLAISDWGFDPQETWMVGDSERDIAAARAAGCRAAMVRSGKTKRLPEALAEVPVFDSLLEFTSFLLGAGASPGVGSSIAPAVD
jgi:histidinol-phosphate phosphatase family protein